MQEIHILNISPQLQPLWLWLKIIDYFFLFHSAYRLPFRAAEETAHLLIWWHLQARRLPAKTQQWHKQHEQWDLHSYFMDCHKSQVTAVKSQLETDKKVRLCTCSVTLQQTICPYKIKSMALAELSVVHLGSSEMKLQNIKIRVSKMHEHWLCDGHALYLLYARVCECVQCCESTFWRDSLPHKHGPPYQGVLGTSLKKQHLCT